jgi:tripartite ATP-independent transporter DctM subunit
MFVGMNIPFAMLFGSAIAIIAYKGPAVAAQFVASDLLDSFSSYTMTVAPLFGLMGFVATYTGIGAKLFSCLRAFIGHKRGGLAQAVQVACCGFGAICGSPPATMATMSAVAYPEMRKAGYSVQLSAMCICEGSTLAVLIPPSGTMVIYGIATEVSISKLFVAGIFPGVLMCCLNCLLIYFIVRVKPNWGPVAQKATREVRIHNLLHGGLIEVFAVFIIAMGGMFAGFFTPTEAGAVGVFGMVLVTLIGRNLNVKRLIRSLVEGARLCAMLYMLLGCAATFGHAISISRLPGTLGRFVADNEFPPVMVLLIIVILYFIFGMIADMMAMVLATIPVFFPLIVDYCGYDPVWFAVLIIFMMSIGTMTPPVASGVFMQKLMIANTDPDVPISLLFGSVWPWVGQRFVITALICIFPGICTWMVDLMF